MKTNKGAVIGLTAILGAAGLGWAITHNGPHLTTDVPGARAMHRMISDDDDHERVVKHEREQYRIPDAEARAEIKERARERIHAEIGYHGRAGDLYVKELEPMIEDLVENGMEIAFGSAFGDAKEVELKKEELRQDIERFTYKLEEKLDMTHEDGKVIVYVNGEKMALSEEAYNKELKPFFKELGTGLTEVFDACIADIPIRGNMSWMEYGQVMSEWGDECGAIGEAFGAHMDARGEQLEKNLMQYEANK